MQESKRATIGISATELELRRVKLAAREHGTDVSNLLRKRSLRWALEEGERLEREQAA